MKSELRAGGVLKGLPNQCRYLNQQINLTSLLNSLVLQSFLSLLHPVLLFLCVSVCGVSFWPHQSRPFQITLDMQRTQGPEWRIVTCSLLP